MSAGIIIESITCDGHKSALKAIKEADKYIKTYNKENQTKVKKIVVQKYLVHIQRRCLTFLKQDHRSVEGRRLRYIAMTTCKLDTIDKKVLFINAFNYWFQQNKEYITQFSYSSKGDKNGEHIKLFIVQIHLSKMLFLICLII